MKERKLLVSEALLEDTSLSARLPLSISRDYVSAGQVLIAQRDADGSSRSFTSLLLSLFFLQICSDLINVLILDRVLLSRSEACIMKQVIRVRTHHHGNLCCRPNLLDSKLT